MKKTNSDYCKEAADALLSAFNWEQTTEGFDFWVDIHNKLLDKFKAFEREEQRK